MMKSDEERPGEGVDEVLSAGEHAQGPAQGPAQDASEAIPEEDGAGRGRGERNLSGLCAGATR